MKKVLIIANLFHASPRVPGLTKYLPEFGWQPVILTTPIGEQPDSRLGPPDNFKRSFRVIETYDYSPKRREEIGVRMEERFNLTSKKMYNYIRPFLSFLYKFYYRIVSYPDSEKGWKPFAVKAGGELLQNEDIDAMLSSSSPVTSHLIARELKNRYKIPWVADFRDLWSQNHNYHYGRLRQSLDKRLELKTLLPADALVTVSEPWAQKLTALHGRKGVYTITNGFDPDKMSKGEDDLTPKFTITYTGPIYTGKQDPAKLFAALQDLVSDGTMDPNKIEVRFYGPENKLLVKQIEGHGLRDIVKSYGIVPRESAFEKQRNSQLLLLLKWEDPQERGCHSEKIFEYLAARRPILATGGSDDVVTELLSETNAGIDTPTVEDTKDTLRRLYAEYKLNGRTSYSGDTEKINKYSYREMARKFAEVLDNLGKERGYMSKVDFNSQFSMSYEDHLEGLGVDNWYRFFFVIKEVITFRPGSVLEIGAGNKVVKNCLDEFVPNYKVIDINPKLNPDIICDLRDFQLSLEGKFDCVICTDVLEHVSFKDLEKGLNNIYRYLTKNGKAIITVPHKRHYFLFISANKAHSFTLPVWITPMGFYSRFIKGGIDPHHCWEIGDGKIERNDVEQVIKKVGFRIDKFMNALYVYFWVLRKL